MHTFEAGGITSLESMEFVIRLPPPNTFIKLVDMNKSLHKAEIYIKDAQDEEDAVAIERAIEIMEWFLDSPAINYLTVQRYFGERSEGVPEVDEMVFTKYRYRRVQAEIFGSKFL